jgi:dTDP-glucose 4,6-dehydratase
MRRNKILITGSAGFVGHHLVEHVLENTDWDIVGLDSFRHMGDSMRVKQSDRYRVFCHDLNAPLSKRLIRELGKVDYIVNMASDSHVDRSIDTPVLFVQNNVNLALNMLEYARQTEPLAFIQISTDEVYGAAYGDHRHAEWSPILPSNPYSASKAAQEAIATSYWRTYGTPVMITNTMNIFGERQDAEKYIPMVISRVLKGEKVTIHGTQSRVGSRYYLHARNMADALVYLLCHQKPTEYYDGTELVMPDRFNIVGDVEIDNLALAQKVADILGKPLHYEFVDFHQARPGHDRRYALDGAKLAGHGWAAPLDLEQSLRKTVEWSAAHPEWLD